MLTVSKIFLFELVCSRSYVRQVHAPLAKFTSGSDYLGLSRDSGTFDLGLNSHEPFEIQIYRVNTVTNESIRQISQKPLALRVYILFFKIPNKRKMNV